MAIKDNKEAMISNLLEQFTATHDIIVKVGNDLTSQQLEEYSKLISEISENFSDTSKRVLELEEKEAQSILLTGKPL